ncbi:hypothetical protein AJ79_06932 [Helicocarpus griseus UAMH5409]|uniref:Metallo-beta-lactamase domain-containing protein n=1 Tax=Helicocarpus griseus UAMH5409 TaxID=1447875 RepID=A0A2B7X7N1_9EURO|nr:hypothetical protein AJ79_06932 [Helicocarpus griseus UAMH5409]
MVLSAPGASSYGAGITKLPPKAVPADFGEKKHHVLTGGFRNPWDSWSTLSAFAIMKALLLRRWRGEANIPDTTAHTIAIRKPEFLENRSTPKLRATWLGHACFYVEFPGGLRVLFDPVLEDYCSPAPVRTSHTKRYTAAPCAVADLPYVDAVFISHNHYDHLCHPTVMNIKHRFPNCHFFVPLGNKQWFLDSGIANVTELDWWEEAEVTLSPSKEKREVDTVGPSDTITARIGCLPCQHTSSRTAWDRSKTLWASWSVESGGSKLYFAGDTGYRAVPKLPPEIDDHGPEHQHKYPHCPAFAQIGSLRGPFDLGLIPIGAYDPRYIMSAMHSDPYDAVSIFLDTKCQRALGMHWGTFTLTEEDVMEPPRKLRDALGRVGVAEEGVFDVCAIGEGRQF